MKLTIRQVPNHPGFCHPKTRPTFVDGSLQFWIMFPGITKFWSRKITVEYQSGFLAKGLAIQLVRNCVAYFHATFILPDNSRSQWFACFHIPHKEGLALVIKPHGRDLVCFDERRNSLFNGTKNVVRLLLDQAWVWKTSA